MTFGEVHIPFWEESGHIRRTCSVTGLYFWTRDISRSTSGDTNEDPYTFIGSPIIDGYPMRGKDLKDEMRKSFLNYFSNNNIEEFKLRANGQLIKLGYESDTDW